MYKLSCEMSAKASIIWLDKTNSQYCSWLVDPLSLSHSCERSLLQNSHTITHIKIAFITRKVKYTSYEHEIFCAHRFLGSSKHTIPVFSKIFTNLWEYVQLNLYDFRWLWLHIRLIAPQMTRRCSIPSLKPWSKGLLKQLTIVNAAKQP